MDLLFGQSDEMPENQPTVGLDDGAGLRVVKARFVSQRKFDWELFAGYDQLRVLTYSASVNAIVRMLNQFSFSAFECVFGCEVRQARRIRLWVRSIRKNREPAHGYSPYAT